MDLEGPGWYDTGKEGKTRIFLWSVLWNDKKFHLEIGEKMNICIEGDCVVAELQDLEDPNHAYPHSVDHIVTEGRFESHELYKRDIYVGQDVAFHEDFPIKPGDRLWIRITPGYLTIRSQPGKSDPQGQ